jgi:uncharacterized protein
MGTPTFVWNELATPDAAKCRDFYTRLLGWTVKESPMGPDFSYHLWQADGKDIGGMYQTGGPGMENVPPHWMTYIGVDDVDAAAARVAELGGTVTTPPMDIPNTGRFCMVKDPGGAMVALFTPSAPQP